MPGDANHDYQVDVLDLVMVVTHWGSCPAAPATCDGDLNGDAVVNVSDLVEVMLNWDVDG